MGSNVPLTVPTVELVTLPGNENYMEERFISFAYRYRYLDNQYSATSLFTKPAFSASEFNFDTRNYLNTGMVNRYNGAIIGFSTGSSLVSEIDLLYKETSSNIIFVIERFKKEDYGWADNTTKTYSFTNSTTQPDISLRLLTLNHSPQVRLGMGFHTPFQGLQRL